MELVSRSPLSVFSFFDQVGLVVPLRLSPGPPRRKEDYSVRDVRQAPKLWA